MASTIEATMPDSAAGNTTRVATRILVAPSAYAPSSSPSGTEDMASSESDEMIGTIIKPMHIPAASALKKPGGPPRNSPGQTSWRSGVTNDTPKKPIATVG